MSAWDRRSWWLLWPVLTTFAVTAEIMHARVRTDENLALEFLGGYAFIVAGLVASRLRPTNRLGHLMTWAGVLWFLGGYAFADVDMVQSIGTAFAGLEPIAIAHLALAYPDGRLSGRARRPVIVGGYFLAAVASLSVLLTFNPRRDVPCDCPSAPLGLFTNPSLLRFAVDSKDKVAAAVVLLAVILLVSRLTRANVTERWLLAPLWVVAVVAGTTFVVRTTVSVVSISDAALGRVDGVLNVMTMLVPAVFLAGLLRQRVEASPLGELVVALSGGTSGESLQRALARALRDPSVELAYWLPARAGYVDAAGQEFTLPVDSDTRSTTLVERDHQRLAAIVHDPALHENPWLIEATTAAAGLALENERLQAQLRAQIVEVQASRMRIVEAGDEARRRLERDLHDGAQQRLLSTALSLRLASDSLDHRADPVGRCALEAAVAETLDAVAELRELARGIHPAVLTERGLRAAVEVLAERSPVPVVVDVAPERFAAPLEATAYFVVSEALANVAKHARASRVRVSAHRDGRLLVVEVLDDGAGGAALSRSGTGLHGLSDRVEAIGGRLELHSPPEDGTRLRVELPCS